MRCWQAAVGASATVLALGMGQGLAAEPPAPCSGESLGVGLSHTLLELSFANNALKLLNGKENRKLRRLIEWKFAASIASARRQIEEGAVVDRAALPSLVPNWLGTIQKAQAYASGHRLTVFEKMDPRENEVKIVDNLTVIREWLERQPRTYPSE